ncbi:MAG: hypothetical protein HC821_04295 [Lewinella sp.]|nr:hypothetical protein [Lewinella sp.]
MRTTTLAHLNRLDADLADLGAALSQYDHLVLNRPAPGGGWSAMQCLQHLRLSEKGSQLYIQKKLSFDPQLPPRAGWTPCGEFCCLLTSICPLSFQHPRGWIRVLYQGKANSQPP